MSTFRAVGQSRLSVRCRRGKLRPKWRAVNVRRTFACLRKRVRRMRIALIRHLMDDPQGGARLVALLARDLQELGEEVTLYCYGYDQARCFPELLAGVAVKCVRRFDVSTSPRRGFETGWRRSGAQLRRYVREAPRLASLIDPRTEIVNPHEWLAHRSAALFGLPRRVPIVWTYNDPSHWHVHSGRSEEHTSELQSQSNLVCRLLLEKKKH